MFSKKLIKAYYKITGALIFGASLSSCIKYNVNGTIPSYLSVADYNNSRVLLYKQWPTANNQVSDLVLGQPDFVSHTNNNGGVSGKSMASPVGVCGDATHFYLSDQSDYRVSGWNSIPTINFQTADFVLGQPQLNQRLINNGGRTRGLANPGLCTVTAGKFILNDAGNNRILVWTSLPTTTYQPPNIALGQPDLNSGGANNPSISGATLSSGQSGQPSSDGVHLVMSDYGNNRVLIWNSFPTMTGQTADLVLGQPDFYSNGINAGAGAGNPSSNTLSAPIGALIINGKLLVADSNARVLIWNSFPTYNQQPADLVLGQPNMNTAGTAPSRQTFDGSVITTDGQRLFVSDTFHNRILIYNQIPTQNYQPADLVLGQIDFNSASANGGLSTNQQTLRSPGGVFSNAVWFGTQTPWGY